MSDRRRLSMLISLFDVPWASSTDFCISTSRSELELWFNLTNCNDSPCFLISIPVFLSIIFIYLSPLTAVKWCFLKERPANLLSLLMDCLLSELWHYIFYPISQGMTSSFIWLTSPLFYIIFSTSLSVSYGILHPFFQFAKEPDAIIILGSGLGLRQKGLHSSPTSR